jgi:hypothetical protein
MRGAIQDGGAETALPICRASSAASGRFDNWPGGIWCRCRGWIRSQSGGGPRTTEDGDTARCTVTAGELRSVEPGRLPMAVARVDRKRVSSKPATESQQQATNDPLCLTPGSSNPA